MIQIRPIDKAHASDIRLPNEPFPLFGRMIPSYTNERWSYTTERFPEPSEMTFPDENYDYDTMSETCTFLGAYDGDQCVGLAVMQEAPFRYMYLYDLKVCSSHRGQGVATALMEKAMDLALEKGYIGVYTQAQDNNLAACLFYLHAGFEIGGFDKKVYEGTKQEGKADIFFYKRGN